MYLSVYLVKQNMRCKLQVKPFCLDLKIFIKNLHAKAFSVYLLILQYKTLQTKPFSVMPGTGMALEIKIQGNKVRFPLYKLVRTIQL